MSSYFISTVHQGMKAVGMNLKMRIKLHSAILVVAIFSTDGHELSDQ